MKTLKTEWLKCQGRRLYLAPLLILAMQIFWGMYNLRKIPPGEASQGWPAILYTFSLLNAMLIPVMAAVVASRIADIEHKGQTLKLLETLTRTGAIFDAKFICAAGYVLAMLLLQTAIILLYGFWRGFGWMVPWDQIGLYLLSTVLVTLTIMLVQLILALMIENQLVGMIIGLMGSFMGLFALFFPQAVQKFLLWAYYGVLSVAVMDWDQQTRATAYSFAPYDWGGLLLLILAAVLLYVLGRQLLIRKEV